MKLLASKTEATKTMWTKMCGSTVDWANDRKKSLKDIKTTFASFNISLGLKLNYPSHATVSATP